MNCHHSLGSGGRRIASWFPILASALGVMAGLAAEKPQPLPPLTTVPGSPRLSGKFVWADLVTDDVPAARTFYSRLFGWHFMDRGGYLIATNDERPVAGILQHSRPSGATAAKPRWFGYISVPSLPKAQGKIETSGGRRLIAASKFPDRGEQAVFADPEGAPFGILKSSAGDPEDFQAEPGDWIWMLLLSRDAERAAEFYRAAAGYEVLPNLENGRGTDYVLASRGYARAAIRGIPLDSRVAPGWLPFVRVRQVTDAAALAKELGGQVLIAPHPGLANGRVAVVADPTGAAVGLMEWHSSLLKGTD